ncbi:MAG: putative Ig domain-containing protein [Acidobacteriota bacterium]|nr:putative Ig domain-containing protein [Acidobacteriota bacterium]
MIARRAILFAVLLAACTSAWGQPGPSVTISPASLPVGGGVFTVGQTIPTQQLFTNFPDNSTIWSISAGALPPSLALNPAVGTITGKATQSGAFTFTVTANVLRVGTGTRQYTIYVSTGLPLTLTLNAPPDGAVGSNYASFPFQAAGGVPSYTWAFQSGTNVDGLTLDPATGLLSGLPQAGGVFPVGVMITDPTGAQTSASFNLNVLGITTPSLPGGAIGNLYSQTLTSVGSTGSLTWSLTNSGTLPTGLTLDPVKGIISGTPRTLGTYPFQVAVTDSATKLTATQSFSISIAANLTVTTTSPLPNGTVGAAYSQTLQATGGTAPYSWTATGIPAGLTLAPTTGILSGTPTAAGTSTIAVTVTDAAGVKANASLSLTVSPAVVTPPSVTITGLPTPIGVAATQPPAAVTLSGPSPVTTTGTLTLAFKSLSGAVQPFDAKFASGSPYTANFTIAAGDNKGLFAGASSVPVMIGTVAGTITITTSIQDSTLTPPAPVVITVSPTVPVITKVTIGAVTNGAFTISVTGRSTTRDMTSALFHFALPTNTQPSTLDVTVPLTTAFTSWYGSSSSIAFGSTFTATVQFSFTGPAGSTVPFTAVTVTLTNSVGSSNAFGPVSP